MKNIYNYSLEELEEYFIKLGYKKYNATQVFEWLYKKRIQSFDEMTNIKKETIELIKQNFKIERLEILTKQTSTDVCKYLFKLTTTTK